MKKNLFAIAAAAAVLAVPAVAGAADLPRRAPDVTKAPVVAPVPTWTGFYVGAQIGYGWGNTDYRGTIVPGGTLSNGFDYDAGGVVGGLHAGFNWQINQFVLGVEGDIEAAGIKDTRTITGPGAVVFPGLVTLGPGQSLALRTEIDWLASLRGRVGVLVAPTLLLYGTGGVGFAGVDNRGTVSLPTVGIDSGDETRVGWTVGAGIEWAFARNWTARAEYRYYDFGTNGFTRGGITTALGTPALTINHRFDTELHTARVGVSYRF